MPQQYVLIGMALKDKRTERMPVGIYKIERLAMISGLIAYSKCSLYDRLNAVSYISIPQRK